MSNTYNPASFIGAAQAIVRIAEVDSVIQNDVLVNYNTVNLRIGSSPHSSNINTTDLHYVYSDNNGVFIGAAPPEGNQALTVMESGNKYHAIQYYAKSDILPKKLEKGQLLLKNKDSNVLNFINNNIVLGNLNNRGLVLNTFLSSSNNNFDHQFSFSQASRSIDGMIKREVSDSGYYDLIKLVEDNIFSNEKSKSVKFINSADDSNFDVAQKIIKNPNFVENRKVVYEFEYVNDILDLESELKLLKDQKVVVSKNNRHKSRLDVLGLTLNDPNYLIESIEGTVVDIYGNLLDLNRYPIKTQLQPNESLTDTFLKLKEDQRRSIAYHFEINARKDLGENGTSPDVKKSLDYARNRSRFFVDIDKEGQFKINIPASSESGNIPLLTRYENINSINASNNPELHPNDLYFPSTNEKKIDILHDSFAVGMKDNNKYFESQKDNLKYNKGLISIKKNGADIAPLDRLSEEVSHVRHGTAHHDILATCFVHQKKEFLNYIVDGSGENEYIINWWRDVFVKSINLEDDLVSKEIEVGKNAGGRSGSINLDGSIELNVGANTIDRQSIWLDTAGGMVANLGKDRNNISAAMSMDGELLIQIGNSSAIGNDQDSRFSNMNTTPTDGVLDVRVLFPQNNQAAVLRIDKYGISLISPTQIHLQSADHITIKSSAKIIMEAESILINERVFEKAVTSINRTIT